MASEISFDDLLEMARQIERVGAEVYLRSAGLAGDEETRRLLERLARDEIEHQRFFTELRAPSPEDPGGERVARALDSLAPFVNGQIISLGFTASELTEGRSVEEILDKSIQFEKDTITFYRAFSEHFHDPADRRRIGEIVTEEQGHVARLEEFLRRRRAGATISELLEAPAAPEDLGGSPNRPGEGRRSGYVALAVILVLAAAFIIFWLKHPG